MYKIEFEPTRFSKTMKEAIKKLQSHEFEEAYKLIIIVLSMNPHAPEPHNLLGLWYEMKGNEDIARKHYRAAYALDPMYKPASKNLERVSSLFSGKNMPFEFGYDALEEAAIPSHQAKEQKSD